MDSLVIVDCQYDFIDGSLACSGSHEDGLFELNDLGSLSRNSEGNLEFEPFESGILTPLYYVCCCWRNN